MKYSNEEVYVLVGYQTTATLSSLNALNLRITSQSTLICCRIKEKWHTSNGHNPNGGLQCEASTQYQHASHGHISNDDRQCQVPINQHQHTRYGHTYAKDS